MSIYQARSSLLSINPRVIDDGDRIEVRTHLLLQALALGSYCQRAIIDLESARIDIQTRRLWIWSSARTIHFEDIDHLDYKHESWGHSWSYAGRTDQVESYRVGVVLRDTAETVWLAAFRGEGATMTGLGGVMIGDSLIDASGTQDDDSRGLVDRLVEILGVPLGQPLISAPVATGWQCDGCRRAAPPRSARCLYCGARVVHRPPSRVARGTPATAIERPRSKRRTDPSGGTAL